MNQATTTLTCSGMDTSGLSRVIQGLVASVGFLGAGVILKPTKEIDIRGLTTVAGIWMTCAIGISAGLGRFGIALVGILCAWMVMSTLQRFEEDVKANSAADDNDEGPGRVAGTSHMGEN